MLIKASWVDDVRNLLGLSAVSQVWGERPSWYVWVADTPGVYRATVENVETEEVFGTRFHAALLSIKCYPCQNSPDFPSFSYEERCLVGSALFDDTNTPRFEHRKEVPDTLFNVASVEYAVDEDDRIAVFTFESLDTMRTSFSEPTTLQYPALDASKRFEKNETDRNVPAAQIGYPFFERLLGLYAFHSRRKPYRFVASSAPGFEYRHQGTNGGFECVESNDIQIRTAGVAFVSEEARTDLDSDFSLPEKLDALLLDEDRDIILFDRTFPCGHFHARDAQGSNALSTPPSPFWWVLAESECKSSLATSCGCE